MKKLPILALYFCCITSAFSVEPLELSPLPLKTNPGDITDVVTQENIHQTICIPGYTKTVRPSTSYTNSLKNQQLHSMYNYADVNPSQYEEDHIVPLAVGGNPTAEANLWPQPRNIEWGASRKDQLEVFVHKAVCKGVITLKEGQEVFLTNWVDHYNQFKLKPHKTFRSTENSDD